jgi:ribose transport system substrate-binding protein
MSTYKTFRILAAATTALALNAFAALADGSIQVDKGMDIASLCGTKPAKVALIDGYGGNTWRKISQAEMRNEAAKCPNITAVDYTDAGGDAQAYNAAINAYVSQGYNIIVTFADFGDSAIPAYRSAMEAGVTVIPYLTRLNGKPGTDYTVNVHADSFGSAKIWAEWTGKSLGGKGNVFLLGGTPNSASSLDFLNGFKEGLKSYPDLKMLDENYIVTNWSGADAQKAVAGLIAKYPQIDAVASDYGVTSLGAIKAFKEAGIKVPAMSAIATNNEISCMYAKDKGTANAWKYFAVDGSTRVVRFALRQGMASYQGIPITEPTVITYFTFADSEGGIEPKCSDTAPPDADLSTSLNDADLNALFNQ